MRKFIKILEATDVLDRTPTNDLPPVKSPPRKKEYEPKSGIYWIKGTLLIRITGSTNEISNLSGQVFLMNPEDFGFSTEDVMDYLKSHTKIQDEYSAVAEYKKYLDGKAGDLSSNSAALWKSSKLGYQMLLENGWAWVNYKPPSLTHFAVTKEAAKYQIPAAANFLSLSQIDTILVTIINTFVEVLDKYPHMSTNKTFRFSKNDYKSFMAAFGGALDFANGKEPPQSNYLYALGYINNNHQTPYSFQPRQINAKTPNGYRKRYAITLSNKPLQPSEGQYLMRIATSVGLRPGMQMISSKKLDTTSVYSDRYFYIKPDEIEVMIDGKWKELNAQGTDSNG